MWNRQPVEEEETSGVPSFLLGALTGVLVGAGVALLFAPKTGKRLRADLAKTYDRASTKITDMASDMMDRAADGVERVAEKYDRASQKAEKVVAKAEDTARKTVEKYS